MNSSKSNCGRVYLVGAGPGDPGLITLRGVQCLKQADVVLYDYLVNPVLARHAPDSAELVCLGQHGGRQRIWTQDEINRKIVEFARAGKTVVRLKGGDPAVFARGGEEAEYLRQHHIDLEIVPGITAALAAGSHAGIPITHRDHASAVALITGREKPGKQPSLNFDSLANFPGTLVFYMGVTTAKYWSEQLIANGKPAATPVALVRRCSLPDQQVVRCRLDEVAEQLTPYSRMPPPVVAIVGEVTSANLAIEWLQDKKLFGQTVLVTRPQDQTRALVERLEAEGAEVIVQPAIEIRAVSDTGPLDDALSRLPQFDWVVFSSANGVRFFMERLMTRNQDARALGSAKLAAIGPATARALRGFSLVADLVPNVFQAEELADELTQQPGENFLLVRASRGRDVLAETLVRSNRHVEQVVAYESVDVEAWPDELLARLQADKIDWVTVTSSAIGNAIDRLAKGSLGKTKLASISPITSQCLGALGHTPAVEADPYTMEGVVSAICDNSQNSPPDGLNS